MSADATLFLVATPLHTFLALGLMQGPFALGERVLAVIDRPPGSRDFVAEALAESAADMRIRVVEFPACREKRAARQTLRRIAALAADLAPSTIACGNDHRLEFHAAAHGAPEAMRAYVDDGLYSYLPRRDAKPRWRERLSDLRRSWAYGVRVERPSQVGGSRAVQRAWVLVPGAVHPGLAAKPVEKIEPAWFARAQVRAVCGRAAARAELDAKACAAIRMLLLLPHPSVLRAHPVLRERIVRLARTHAARGECVAFKNHPNPGGEPVRIEGAFEIPARLPAETLAPLLHDALVVGSVTTAMLSLALLGRGLDVRSLALPDEAPSADRAFDVGARRLYASVGILPLEEGA